MLSGPTALHYMSKGQGTLDQNSKNFTDGDEKDGNKSFGDVGLMSIRPPPHFNKILNL